MRCRVKRPADVTAMVLAAASLAVGGCASTVGNASATACSKAAAGTSRASSSLASASTGSRTSSSPDSAAVGWTLPGADLQNRRDVASVSAARIRSLLLARGARTSCGIAAQVTRDLHVATQAEVAVNLTDDRGAVAHGCGDAFRRPLANVARSEHAVHRCLVGQARPRGAWRDSDVGQHESVDPGAPHQPVRGSSAPR